MLTMKPIHILAAYTIALLITWKLTPVILWATGTGGDL